MASTVITAPTLIRVNQGVTYYVSCEGAAAILKEPRSGQPYDPRGTRPQLTSESGIDTSTWEAMHGSPIAAGTEAPTLIPFEDLIEVSAASYPMTINLVHLSPLSH